MNLKYIRYAFIITIIVLIILGIYMIYIKDNDKSGNTYTGNKQVEISKDINIGITEFETINPILSKSLEVQYITKLIYEPLVNITQDFNTEPGIAEEWSKLDELTYIIKIDEEKIWQNGEKVKVEDIEFTIKTIKENDSIYNENVEQIERIEKVDENTLKIHLKEPVEFFEYMLCFPIVQKNTYNADVPVGSGKYKIEGISEDEIKISGEDRKITIKIYNSITELYNNFTRENVDLILTKNTNYDEHIGNIGFEETAIPGREFYYISCENIENIETRKIIESKINKDRLIYDLYNKRYIKVEFPLEYGSYLNKQKSTDEEIESNKNIRVTLSIKPDEETRKIAKILKEQLEENEIDVIIQYYQNKRADMILKKQTVPITPSINMYFNDENVKEQIAKITNIENKEILKQEYEKIIEQYYEEKPFISLYFNSYIILHNNNLKGDFSGNWYNIFYNIDTWYKI